jgi:hypothetical protein
LRTDIAAMASALRDAFASAGPKVEERRTGTGRAYLVGGRVVGQVDETPGSLRVRMWLVDKDRSAFEGRPTFDARSGWMVVVSDEDVGFVRGLVPVAYRAADEGKPTATPTVEAPGQTTRAASPPPPSESSSPRTGTSGRPSRSRPRPRS